MDDTRNLDEIRDILKTLGATRYVWQGDEDAPEGGDEVWLGGLAMTYATDYSEGETYVGIPFTAWGDYHGSTLERANYTALLEDYREHVVVVSSGYGGHALLLREGLEYPETLIETIEGLEDYPLVDDQALSDVEIALEDEDWKFYGRDELRAEIRSLAEEEDADDAVIEAEDDDWLDDLYYTLRQDDVVTWCAETATGGYFQDLREGAAEGWKKIKLMRDPEERRRVEVHEDQGVLL